MITIIDDPEPDPELEFTEILYMSPPVGDRRWVFENNRHHPSCRPGRSVPGCLHWQHQPWRSS